jgi:hypothetical protein
MRGGVRVLAAGLVVSFLGLVVVSLGGGRTRVEDPVDAAVGLEGCYGARLTGAGFGGCTVSLVAASRAERFATELSRAYRQATGVIPGVWICEAAEGAEVIVPAAA